MSIERVDSVVIGAGVVGLACARALALAGREVLILEAENTFGTGISSRNSEVIHAGLYYPPGSLKARLCVAGRDALYAYCATRAIPHRRCGKLIVAASDGQIGRLEQIRNNALACGAGELELLDGDVMRRLEPALAGAAALDSPATGIVDSHALMLALLADAEHAGAQFASHAPVDGLELGSAAITLSVGGAEPMRLAARQVVNAAGLGAARIASASRGLDPAFAPTLAYAKGNYFMLQGRAPFSRLIYPVPEAAGLGVHLTLDLAGQARFGPDVEWTESPEYSVSADRAKAFAEAIRHYWPALPDGALQPGYAGVRPKLGGPGDAAADFRIDGPAEHGHPGLVNLLGIESPGLTACLAIADEVLRRLG